MPIGFFPRNFNPRSIWDTGEEDVGFQPPPSPIGLSPTDFGNLQQQPTDNQPVGLQQTTQDLFPLRAQNIFSPQNQQAPTKSPYDIDIDAMMAQYQPKHAMSDVLAQQVQNVPEHPQHGFWGNLGQIATGVMMGPEAADYWWNMPYYNQMRQWKQKTGAAEKAAVAEEATNRTSLNAVLGGISRELTDRRIDELQRHAVATEQERAARDAQIHQIKEEGLAITRYKMLHPNHQVKVMGNQLVGYDPATNQAEVLNDSNGNPIDGGKLDDSTKMNIQLQNQLALVNARTAGQLQVTGARGEQERQNIAARGGEARETKTTPPAAKPPTAAKDLLPGQKLQEEYRRARELWNSRPDLRPFIKMDDKRKSYKITNPQEGGFFTSAPTQDKYDEINNYIKGTPQAPAGWKYIHKPGGGWTAVEDK